MRIPSWTWRYSTNVWLNSEPLGKAKKVLRQLGGYEPFYGDPELGMDMLSHYLAKC